MGWSWRCALESSEGSCSSQRRRFGSPVSSSVMATRWRLDSRSRYLRTLARVLISRIAIPPATTSMARTTLVSVIPRASAPVPLASSRRRRASTSVENDLFNRPQVVLAADYGRGLAERGVRVLQAVAGEDADDGRRGRVALDPPPTAGHESRHGSRRRRLAEDPFPRREEPIRVEDLLVRDRGDPPARRGHRRHRLLPARGVADADCRGDRLRALDRMTLDQRRSPCRLKAVENWSGLRLAESPPPRRDVPRVADRDRERARGLAEFLQHLERSRLLALDAVRMDRVDEFDRVTIRELADDPQGVVEVPAQGDHPRAVHERLRQLADGDLSFRNDHRPAHPRPGGVGGRARGGVASRRADHGL